MNKSSLIGFILIAAILFGWMWWMQPSKEQIAEQKRIQDSIRMARQEAAILDSIRLAEEQAAKAAADTIPQAAIPETVTDSATLALMQYQQSRDKFGVFASASNGEEQLWTVENDLQRITFSSKGGYIKEVELKAYQTYDSMPLISFDPETAMFDLSFFSNNRIINTSQLYFQPFVNGMPYEGGDLAVGEGGTLNFAMRAYADTPEGIRDENQYLEYSYVIPGDNYMLGFNLKTVGLNGVLANNVNYMNLDWKVDLLQHEKDVDRFINTTVYYRSMIEKDVDRLNDRKHKEETINSSVNWVSFKERFFCNVLVAEKGFGSAKIGVDTYESANPKYFKTMSAELEIPYNPNAEVNEFPMSFYFGPNHFKTLKSYDLQLQRQIDVGNFFLIRWINYGVIYVFNWLGSYGWNYGIVILILTILIKILLFPIAFKSYKSTAITRILKPEMEAIAAKYPKEEDAMKKQQAVMELQRQAGASPTSGCIPMLLQFPILIAVFRFFPSSIELRQQSFLWAEDLSTYDSVLDLPFNIPFYGDHVSLFCLLMTVTTFIYTYVNNKQMDTTANPQMKGMKIMMYLMPIMFLGIFNSYSAGLSYYYMLANIITFLQMFVFRKMIKEEKVRATIEENKRKPQKKSRFQQRLEAAQKAQQQQMRNR